MKKKHKLVLSVLVIQIGVIAAFTGINAPTIYANLLVGPYLSWSGSDGLQNLTSTTITVSWRTPTPSIGYVKYGVSPDLEFAMNETEETTQHQILIEALSPNTTYFYKVGDGNYWTRVYTFKTLETDPEDVKFCLWSDTQPPGSQYRRVFEQMNKREMDFWVQSGDLVSTGGSMDQWESYLRTIRPLSSQVAFMPVSGNHEYYGEPSDQNVNFQEVFALPGSESTYGFIVDNVLFIALNTQESSLWSDGHAVKPEDWAWANQTLFENYLNVDWIILYCHYPPYTSSWVSQPVYDDIVPLAEKYDVDAVFTGHIHNYERFDVPNGQTLNSSNISYWVMGGGGGNLGSLRDEQDPFSQVYSSQYHYLHTTINDTAFHIDSWGVDDDQIFDSWFLTTKDRSGLSSYW